MIRRRSRVHRAGAASAGNAGPRTGSAPVGIDEFVRHPSRGHERRQHGTAVSRRASPALFSRRRRDAMARAARGGAGESAVKPGRRSAFGGQARCQLAPVPPPPPRGRLQPPPLPPPTLTGLESVHWFIGGPNPGQGQSPWPRPAQCAAMAAGPAASGPPSAQHRPDKPAHDKPAHGQAGARTGLGAGSAGGLARDRLSTGAPGRR